MWLHACVGQIFTKDSLQPPKGIFGKTTGEAIGLNGIERPYSCSGMEGLGGEV